MKMRVRHSYFSLLAALEAEMDETLALISQLLKLCV